MTGSARFAGYRLVEFSPATRGTLKEVAERLIPREKAILNGWLSRQFATWHPPGLGRAELGEIFGGVLGAILHGMRDGSLEACIGSLEQAGANLAKRQFPFSALIITVHFLEETYIPLLLDPPPPDPRKWLLEMDEFLHVALAAIASAYFESYRTELLEQAEVGRIVQEGLLGRVPRRAADLEVAHVYMSAREQAQLGGDFLDSFEMDGGSVLFVIGDLSGHGLEAAADSVMLRSLFRGFMRENADPADAMTRLNRVIRSDLGTNDFATALALVYDSPGKFRMVNAGHPYPVLCGGECRLVETHDAALAILADTTYAVEEVTVGPGGVLVAYTDGLTEARDKGGMFGDDRVLDTVARMQDASPRAIAEQLIDDAQRHAGGKFSDDVAVLVLKRDLV
jgi:serine phosphatase RsbU (regulator of sigma subunit)